MLELIDCGLASIPAALTALRGSMTRLAMQSNNALQLEHDDFLTLLSPRQLQTLDLRKYYDSYDDYLGERALWSQGSVQHLEDLPAAFWDQCGHALALEFAIVNTDRQVGGYDDDDDYSDRESTYAFGGADVDLQMSTLAERRAWQRETADSAQLQAEELWLQEGVAFRQSLRSV